MISLMGMFMKGDFEIRSTFNLILGLIFAILIIMTIVVLSGNVLDINVGSA